MVSIKLIEDVGMSKPKKQANKVGIVLTQEVNIGPTIKQTTSYISTYTTITLSCNCVVLYGSGLFESHESYSLYHCGRWHGLYKPCGYLHVTVLGIWDTYTYMYTV